MKRYKKMLSMLMAVVMVLSLNITSAASDTSAAVLNDLGLLLNISDTELDAVLTRDVGLTMILKSLGYDQTDANKAAANGNFTDVKDWAKGWAELAYDLGITTGVGNNKFNPKGNLTNKEFVAFLLRALGYDTADAWTEAVVLGRTAGLIDDDDNLSDTHFTKREAAGVMYNALLAIAQGTSMTLIEQLVDDGIVSENKAEAHNLIVGAFEVTSYNAGNLKVISLNFSKAVDESSLSNDSISVYIDNDLVLFDSDYLDGVISNNYALHLVSEKQVDIVFGSAKAQSTRIKFEVEGLMDTDGDTIKPYERTISLNDMSVPYPMSVTMLNPIYLEIAFNEPVQFKTGARVHDEIRIDGNKMAGTSELSNDKQIIYLKLVNPLEGGAYEVSIEDVMDYAGFVSDKKTFDIVAVEDTTAPYVVEAKALNRNEVVIDFSETIIEDEGEITIEGRTYELDDEDDQDFLSIDGAQIKVTLEDPLPASAATTGITGSFDDIEDMIGNRVTTDVNFSFKAPYDTVPPTMDVEVDSSNDIIVTFSEAVMDFGYNNFAVTEYDEDEDSDVMVGIKNVGSVGNSEVVFRIELSDPTINQVEYNLIVMGVKDVSVFQNRLAKVELTLTMSDKEQPEVESVKYLGEDMVRITFSEPMDYDDLSNPYNYSFYDKSENETIGLEKVDDYDIDVSSDRLYVELEIPGLRSVDRIEVGKIEDLSGITIKDAGDDYAMTMVEDFEGSDLEARLINGTTIKLIADGHEFEVIDEDDFLLRSGNSESNSHYIYNAYLDDDDSSIAYVKLSSSLDADAKYNGKKQYLFMADDVRTIDAFNQELEIAYGSPLLIEDYVDPDIDLDLSESEMLIITFSEVVGTSSDSEWISDILLRDSDGDIVDLILDDNVELSGGNGTYNFFDTITISDLTSDERYSIELVSRNIEDDNGNAVNRLDKKTVTIE